jgi:transposase
VSPQYVKPFVRRQKNDGNDAEVICTAVQQPNMRFVPLKTVEQQDVQSLHRARQRLINHRTALFIVSGVPPPPAQGRRDRRE